MPGVPLEFPNDEGFLSWRNFFLKADKVLKFWDRLGSQSIRGAGHPPRRAVDAGADALFRRPGRDLSVR